MLTTLRAITFLLGIPIAMMGCKAERLSAQECRVIRDRELAYMSSLLKPSSIDLKRADDSSDKALAKCVSGEMYSREDFKCIDSADTELAMSRCMARVHEKAGR